jgi:hypothetical protein
LGQELCEHRPSSCALPRSPSPYLCPWLCTCCWRCAIATAVPPTFTSTSQHRVEALSFLAEPVHAHSRTREVDRRRMSPTNAAGPFLAVLPVLVPCLVHAINFVSLPRPSRRRSARTHTHTTERPSPCFTYLWPYSTFRRAVAANPNAPAHECCRAIDPKFGPFGHFDPEHRLA